MGFYFLLQKPKVQLNGSKATAVFAQNQFLPSTNLKAPSPCAFAGFWAQKLLTCNLPLDTGSLLFFFFFPSLAPLLPPLAGTPPPAPRFPARPDLAAPPALTRSGLPSRRGQSLRARARPSPAPGLSRRAGRPALRAAHGQASRARRGHPQRHGLPRRAGRLALRAARGQASREWRSHPQCRGLSRRAGRPAPVGGAWPGLAVTARPGLAGGARPFRRHG